MRPTRFTTAASVVSTVSLPLADVSTLLLGGPGPFVGNALAAGVVGTVFAGDSTYSVRRYGQPRLAAALVCGATEVAPVAAVQSFGVPGAAFAGYTTVEALEPVARDRPLDTGD